MASPEYNPPQYATEYIFYISLSDLADPTLFKSNPTLATGDFKVSKDGGTLTNLGTLPAVTPASSKVVKVTLSAAEMTADNIVVLGSDAAGAEWCDYMVCIQPSKMADPAATIVRGTVDNTAFTPTTTSLEADDITEATADHYNGRVIIFTSGALQNQVTNINDYELSGGRGKFTYDQLTEAPGNNDTFVIV